MKGNIYMYVACIYSRKTEKSVYIEVFEIYRHHQEPARARCYDVEDRVVSGQACMKAKCEGSVKSLEGWRNVASVEKTRLGMTIRDVGGRRSARFRRLFLPLFAGSTSFVPFLVADTCVQFLYVHTRTHTRVHNHEPLNGLTAKLHSL